MYHNNCIYKTHFRIFMIRPHFKKRKQSSDLKPLLRCVFTAHVSILFLYMWLYVGLCTVGGQLLQLM